MKMSKKRNFGGSLSSRRFPLGAVTRNDEIEGLGTRMENSAALAGDSRSSFVSWEKSCSFIQQEVEVQAKVRGK